MKTNSYTTTLSIIALMLFSVLGALAQTEPQHGAQKPMQHDASKMDMDPYFTALNYPVPQDTMMVMLLSDFQAARSTNDFFTGMGMVQYGLTPRWTVGFMVEGQKISGLPTTYGGFRINSYFRVFPIDHLLNLTLYGEYEGLNGASLCSAIPYRSTGPFASSRHLDSSASAIRLCCAWGSDIRSTTFYIGDHRLCEQRCGLGSVPAESTPAAANLKLS